MQALTVHWKRQVQYMTIPAQHSGDHTTRFVLHQPESHVQIQNLA